MRKLLCIVGGMNVGGAETFVMKILRKMNRNDFMIDFCCAEKGFYDEEISLLGGKIYYYVPKTQGFFKSFKSIKKIVKQNGYKNVMRISATSVSSIDLLAAKMPAAKNLIFRSSNSNCCGNKLESIIHKMFVPFCNYISTIKISPSKEAARFMFGKNYKKKNVLYLKNGIDLECFSFSSKNRDDIRRELNIADDCVVFGHVGRMSEQKNDIFLVDSFLKYRAYNNNSKLIILGKTDENILNEIISKYSPNIFEHILFLGVREDAYKFYSSFDAFLMPSLFEGMPNALIEAQMSGLLCLASDTITKESNVSGLVNYLPIFSSEIWANEMIGLNYNISRENQFDAFRSKGYSIDDVVEVFQNEVILK